MEKETRRKQISSVQSFARSINTILLLSHVCFLLLFIWGRVYLMILMNLFSLMVYLTSYETIKKSIPHFMVKSYIEVLVHIVLSIFCLGMDYGFQFHFFALIPIIFYYEYASRKNGGVCLKRPVILSIAIAVFFVAAFAYLANSAPFYPIEHAVVKNTIFLFNTFVTFGIMTLYMFKYIRSSVQTENALMEASTRDPLTKLCNRRNMLVVMDSAFDKCVDMNHEMAIAILDIDDFKKVNDIYGHNAGDYILREVAQEILFYEKDGDVMTCRWGGEEFVLMMTGPHSYKNLKEKMEKLVITISKKLFRFDSIEIPVTITAGIAKYRHDATIDALIARADQYLYEGKNNGKNQLVFKDVET